MHQASVTSPLGTRVLYRIGEAIHDTWTAKYPGSFPTPKEGVGVVLACLEYVPAYFNID